MRLAAAQDHPRGASVLVGQDLPAAPLAAAERPAVRHVDLRPGAGGGRGRAAARLGAAGGRSGGDGALRAIVVRSEEHTSQLQSLMPNSYAVFCLKKKKTHTTHIEKLSKQHTKRRKK